MNGQPPATSPLLRRLLETSRVEDALALVVTALALAFFFGTTVYSRFELGLIDFFFILLPVLLLLLRMFFTELLAFARSTDQSEDPEGFLWHFLEELATLFRDWFPFFLLSAFYFSLYTNFILRINPHTADRTLAAIDEWFLGSQAAFLLEPYVHPAITFVLNTTYVSYLFYFPGIALYLYVTGRHTVFRRYMLGLLVLMGMGVVSYILVPAIGPGKFFYEQLSRGLDEQNPDPLIGLIHQYRVVHDCFPSLHVGIPLLIAVYAWEAGIVRWAVAATVYVLLMMAATVYLRFHYVVDVVAVFAYVPVAHWLTDLLLTRWPGWQTRLISFLWPPPEPTSNRP